MSKVTGISPFVGYAQNEDQTERKRLRNVLKKGDLYFNSGDLMRIDSDNFIYFQDRVGDTFRYITDVRVWRDRQTHHHCPSISAWKDAKIMLNVSYMKGTSFKDYRILYLHVSLHLNYFTSIPAVVKHKPPDFYHFLCPLVLTGGKVRTWRRLKCRTSWRWAVVSKRPTFTVSECQVIPPIPRNK